MRASLTFALAFALVACGPSPSAPGDPAMVTLAPGQSVTINGLTLKFIGVPMDSRCPANATCVQAGDAAAAIETRLFAASDELELRLRDADNRSTTRGPFLISFEALSPYPFLPTPIRPQDYRAEFLITAR